LKKPCPTYAAPVDREDLDRGVFLVALRGALDKDSSRNRQRAFDQVMEQFEEGLPPFDSDHCFDNGLSEHDLIYIPSSTDFIMSKTKAQRSEDTLSAVTTAPEAASKIAPEAIASEVSPSKSAQTTPEQDDIILAASEILELAKLKVSLTYAYRDAREYKDLLFKVVDIDGGPLNDAECEVIGHKNFAKSIKGLAEAKVKVSQWYENASGNHELILNELAFMEEELASALETAENNGKAVKAKETAEV
jgi:hypothetical protein